MKIKARVLVYKNGEPTVHEVEITEKAMARLAKKSQESDTEHCISSASH